MVYQHTGARGLCDEENQKLQNSRTSCEGQTAKLTFSGNAEVTGTNQVLMVVRVCSRSVELIAAALFAAGCRGGAPSSSTSALPSLFAKGTYYSLRDPRVEVVFLTSNEGFVALPIGAGSVVSPGVPRHRYYRFTYSLNGDSLDVTFDSPEGTLKSKRISVKNMQSRQASTAGKFGEEYVAALAKSLSVEFTPGLTSDAPQTYAPVISYKDG